MIKNCDFFLSIHFALAYLFVPLIIELEQEIPREYAQGIVCNKEATLSIYFVLFKEFRLFFETNFLKAELIKPKCSKKSLSCTYY